MPPSSYQACLDLADMVDAQVVYPALDAKVKNVTVAYTVEHEEEVRCQALKTPMTVQLCCSPPVTSPRAGVSRSCLPSRGTIQPVAWENEQPCGSDSAAEYIRVSSYECVQDRTHRSGCLSSCRS